MKKCIINFEDKDIIEKMRELGYDCIPVIKSDCVSGPISQHSDVLYLKTDNNEIIVSACQKPNFRYLEESGYHIVVCDILKPGYRTESWLNFIVNNDYIIYNPETAYKIIVDKNKIVVKQGYTRCSTICVNSRAYITDDENIFNTLLKNNLDCLKIEKGDIKLEGYDYGFIGGASVKLNDNEILFFGDLKNKKDKSNVISFLKKYNVKPIFIENKEMHDIGSVLIL
ncbi:MAG: hypothetical protein IKU54_06385 [Oscillospiraceae bacterium]|nr:hypothetical protein [Oscillospiraceae bacterium]